MSNEPVPEWVSNFMLSREDFEYIQSQPELMDPLGWLHLDLTPKGDKGWVRHFNGQLRPLTAQGLSAGAEEQGHKKAIGKVHMLLTNCPLIKVDRLHNGGSFGRRTMVRGLFDVDVTAFVTTYKGRVLGYHDWTGEEGEALQVDMMRELAAWLQNQGWKALDVEYGTHYKNCINMTVDGVEVDIKLAPNMARGSQASDRGKVQRKILMKQVLGSGGGAGEERPQAEPAREAGLSEALTAVVKDTSDRVKSVARLVKCWYKYSLKDKIPHVPSVLLEVLTLAAAQREGLWYPVKNNRTAEVELFLAALTLLDAAVTSKEVVVLEAGPVWGYSRAQAESCRHTWQDDTVVVLHPIDPTCNLARAQPDREVDWPMMAWEARELRQVVRKDSMWTLLNESSLAPAIRALR
ncbi:hypothetical protein CHLRE_05g234666v5 [Chlamydomonas reinhardtii]|uniref:2'-5'-oligoadenylate synthetase 1 domain-containing protein n=1 Tax=Chlamydomonas reinhardtii TaxID=3055 RepID=A0A2K3DSN6_CHLRE|nr:uncharacterized protein CHLRE_05g234666v5 [Chlamydomonas reinhardtii]PNW83554.1 hypothetical protein CHLRE_05g234666v5 [Chlamydomonas reinhardtii]